MPGEARKPDLNRQLVFICKNIYMYIYVGDILIDRFEERIAEGDSRLYTNGSLLSLKFQCSPNTAKLTLGNFEEQ